MGKSSVWKSGPVRFFGQISTDRNRNRLPIMARPQITGLSVGHGYGLPGGYAGKGTVGTGTGTVFCTHHHTLTLTRHTRTYMAGITYINMTKSHGKKKLKIASKNYRNKQIP